MNQKNSLGLNKCFKDMDDPIELFGEWFNEAKKTEINDPNAVALATADNKGLPSVRMVLLKDYDKNGFVFYTNLNSKKSLDLKENPSASLCFHWKSLLRQIRLTGAVSKVSEEEADKYYKTRSYNSRIGAWASQQSEVLKNREQLNDLIDEFKKLLISDGFLNLAKDEFSYEIINLIFPQFKNLHLIKNLNKYAKENIKKVDFVFLISLMIIDGSDNVEYFIYKFNISKKDKKRILFLNDYFKNKNSKIFNTKDLWKVLYFNGKESLLDLINFQIFKSKKIDKKLLNLLDFFKDKEAPLMPLRAITLMTKYKIPEGKDLGLKLKKIENKWVDNNFKISEKEVQKLINN